MGSIRATCTGWAACQKCICEAYDRDSVHVVDTLSPKVSPRKRQVLLDEDDPIEESVQESTSIAAGSSKPQLSSWEQTNAPSSSASGPKASFLPNCSSQKEANDFSWDSR